jgi:hypothetical protein
VRLALVKSLADHGRRASDAERLDIVSQLVARMSQLMSAADFAPPTVIVAILDVAGELGGRCEVDALLPLSQGAAATPQIKAAARKALAGIRDRLGEAAAGRLSVPEGLTGAS